MIPFALVTLIATLLFTPTTIIDEPDPTSVILEPKTCIDPIHGLQECPPACPDVCNKDCSCPIF